MTAIKVGKVQKPLTFEIADKEYIFVRNDEKIIKIEEFIPEINQMLVDTEDKNAVEQLNELRDKIIKFFDFIIFHEGAFDEIEKNLTGGQKDTITMASLLLEIAGHITNYYDIPDIYMKPNA